VAEIPGDIARADTLARQIRDALLERMLSGQLLPGTRLKDNEVAAMFGTSNTPAREALRLLARDGLVDILPYRGCMVRAVDAQEIGDIYDVCILIAGHVARLAAARLTDEVWRRLEAAADEHDHALAAGDRERVEEAADRFHRLLVDAAGNRVLARMHRYLSNRIRIARRVCLRETPAEEIPCRTLLAALRAGDGAQAEAILTEHIARGKEEVCEALRAAEARSESLHP